MKERKSVMVSILYVIEEEKRLITGSQFLTCWADSDLDNRDFANEITRLLYGQALERGDIDERAVVLHIALREIHRSEILEVYEAAREVTP
jgi:hypothetical protein